MDDSDGVDYWTALSDLMDVTEYSNVLKEIWEDRNESPLVNNGAVDDGALITAPTAGLMNAGMAESERSDDEENNEDGIVSARGVFLFQDALNCYDSM